MGFRKSLLEKIDYVYIYALIDPLTNEVRYIGKTNNKKRRIWEHNNESKLKRTHKEKWIQSLKNKGAEPIFDIVDIVQLVEWQFWEKHYMSLYKSWGFDLVNGAEGGIGGSGMRGRKHSAESIEKIKMANKGKVFGHMSEELKKKISDANRGERHYFYGKHHSEESKKNMSQSHIGVKHSKETKEKISNNSARYWLGKEFTEEMKEKMSKTRKESEKIRGDNHPNRKLSSVQVKKIRSLYSEGKYFYKDLAEMFKVCITTISLIINNKTWIRN